jgi:hypothetical protein
VYVLIILVRYCCRLQCDSKVREMIGSSPRVLLMKNGEVEGCKGGKGGVRLLHA